MSEATVIYPHQLFTSQPALQKGRPVYLVEEPLLLTYNPIHRQKLHLHFKTLDYYEEFLTSQDYLLKRILVKDYPTTESVFKKLSADGITDVHIVDTTDYYLEKAIKDSGLNRIWYESPLFVLSKEEAVSRFKTSKKSMASFYKKLRQDKNILLDDNKPVGGQWSFDKENRKSVPKKINKPKDIVVSKLDTAESKRVEAVAAEKYGTNGSWLPTTHQEADDYLQDFLHNRFYYFGDYEDAIANDNTRLWHSTLSPLINIGLLTPQYVIEQAINYADRHDTPINSLEGFIRQILGWREFIRASYETEHRLMRGQNFFQHTKLLPSNFWTGNTGLPPVDHTIKNSLQYGYAHHIERLMVMGNIMLLLGIHPTETYRWFMAMYIDAYDWVMVPNVYGMSQFADGGSFATKPYISGANYLLKMSNYQSGDWEHTWTALYWSFIDEHQAFFKNNHRLSMMPSLLAKMDKTKRRNYLQAARLYKSKIFN